MSSSSPWNFREASGLVLEVPEAAGTARHRTRQPGEISRPSSSLEVPGKTSKNPFQFLLFQAFFQANSSGISSGLPRTKDIRFLSRLFKAFFQAKPQPTTG